MSSAASDHSYNSLATEIIVSEINYFIYKESFDIKILDVSATFNYVTSNVSAIILSNISQKLTI
jgi:hypothetical protein